MRNFKLFYSGCREKLSVKKSVLELHLKSQKHQRGKERIHLKNKREVDLSKALKEYDAKHHPTGEMLPETTHLYRIKMLTSFSITKVPLSKIDGFRDLLEEHVYSLSDSSNLRKLISFILETEINRLKESICGKYVSIIFDGTTYVCEALVIVLQYVEDWVVKHRFAD